MDGDASQEAQNIQQIRCIAQKSLHACIREKPFFFSFFGTNNERIYKGKQKNKSNKKGTQNR